MGYVNAPDVDTTAMVYDLRGQGTAWTCSPAQGVHAPGQNCMRSAAVPKGVGQCYRTTFGDWKCGMTVGGPDWENRLPGPRQY